MDDRGNRVLGPAPGEDPWEFEWPDDTKELRQAEREAASKSAEVEPAPRFFSAYLVGVWTVLAFVLAITLVIQFSTLVFDSEEEQGADSGALIADVSSLFLRLVAPIALIGLLAALPLGYVLNMLTQRLNKGVAGLIFMLIGGFIGFFWSYAIITWLFSHDGIPIDNANASDRMAAALLFMTATATAFVVARYHTDNVRKNPKAVYVAAIVLFVLFIPSVVFLVQDLVAYL